MKDKEIKSKRTKRLMTVNANSCEWNFFQNQSHLGPLCFIWFVNRISMIFEYFRALYYAEAVSSRQEFSGMYENSV
jgi:hypothetical protein